MENDLFRLLSEKGEGVWSGSALGRELGITRAAVHKRIVKLRREGCGIEGSTRTGYRLTLLPDLPVSGDYPPGWGRPFFFFDTIPSTQDEAKRLAVAGSPAGTLVVASRQTRGRGRLGRSWESPPGGLWYSLLLRPDLPPSSAAGLALVAALDWAKLLQKAGVDSRLKWPNDVWVGGKKLAGVLTETSAEADRLHWLVLGIGLNVRNDGPRDVPVPSASLKDGGGPWSRRDLLAGWMARFRKSHDLYLRDGFDRFRREYESFSLLQGRRVSWESSGRRESGKVLGVDSDGRLRVRTSTGPWILTAGDVSLVRNDDIPRR